jgi:site-specific recombinase XerD
VNGHILPEHVAKLRTTKNKKLRASRQARLLNVDKSFYSFATKYQYLPSNPALAVGVPKSEDALAERLLMLRDAIEQAYYLTSIS